MQTSDAHANTIFYPLPSSLPLFLPPSLSPSLTPSFPSSLPVLSLSFPSLIVITLAYRRDPLVQAADMTNMDLKSLLSDLVMAKQRMREQRGIHTRSFIYFTKCMAILI